MQKDDPINPNTNPNNNPSPNLSNTPDRTPNSVTPETSHIYNLKYHNPEGDSIGFRYSKYKDSFVSSNENKKNPPNEESINSEMYEKIGQTRLMFWKNFLIFSRNAKTTIFQFFTPIGVCLLLLLIQALCTNFSQSIVNKDPQPVTLTNLTKCEYPDDCTTIGYGVISKKNKTNEYVEKIMQYVAESNNLEADSDVKLVSIGDSDSYTNYISNNQNKTKYGVVFCLDEMEVANITIPCTFNYINKTFHLYTILYNFTNQPNGFLGGSANPYPTYPDVTKLKIDMDNAFLKYYSIERGLEEQPSIEAVLKAYPVTENRFLEGNDIVASFGAFYFFFPPMITFVVILLEIIREKDLKLRKVSIK